jgi:hypothetical protein
MTVSSSSKACLRALEFCVESVPGNWPEDQLFRFNVWTSNSGAFAGRASMDSRLSGNKELQVVMVELLDLMSSQLNGRSFSLQG